MFSYPFSFPGGSPFGGRVHSQKRNRNRPSTAMPVNREGHFTTIDGISVRKLFIANLSSQTVERHLAIAFRIFGKIVDVSIIKIPNSKSNFGFVTFETPAEATRALKKRHSIFILNRKIYVSPADSWHQPLELPNGEILWDRRKASYAEADENGFADDDKITGLEETLSEALVLVDGDEVDCPVSQLNDDCLLLIFDWLPMDERLVLNKVCRRWKLLNMRMWHGLKTLDFTVRPLVESTLTDELLRKYLALCPNIVHINIAQDGHKLTADAIVTIANCCKRLESIAIRDIKIHKRSLAFLSKNCPMLKSFSMDACTSQHDGEMVALVKKSCLEEISLKYSALSIGLWLKHLHPPLKSVSLEMYAFNSDYLLQGIYNVKDSLKELKFVSCESIRSRDVEKIASIVPELSSLTLAGGFDFKSHSLTPITKLKKLTRLDLDNNAFVCDHFLLELSQQCNLLKYLSLSGIDDRYLTVQGLTALSKFTRLTHLTLACLIKLDDFVLKSISQKVKNLQHLDLTGCCSITDEGCRCIVTNCKELEILDVSGCMNVTNNTVTAAIDSSLASVGKKKLKIIAGESGIDVDICWSPEVIVDPSCSIMSQPGTMLIIDPELRYDDDFFNNLFMADYDLEDFYNDESGESSFDEEDYDDDDDDFNMPYCIEYGNEFNWH